MIVTVLPCFQFAPGDSDFKKAHPPMGIVITILVILNVRFYIILLTYYFKVHPEYIEFLNDFLTH